MYMLRAVGGTLYISGVVLMAFNLYKTAKSGRVRAGHGSPGRAAEAEGGDAKTVRGAIAGWRPSR